jgi:tetratricopeptide (TPR) repeat protein
MGLIFAAALALRWSFVAQYETHHPQAQLPAVDEASYDSWARAIAGGEWLGREIFFQEPLYPYWLGSVYALAGADPVAQRALARRAQAVLGAICAVLIGLVGRQLGGSGVGLVAAGLFAVYRPAIWMNSQLLKPSLFLPLWTAFAWLLARACAAPRASARNWFAIGALAGLGVLLRGNVLILSPLFVLWPAATALVRQGARAVAGAWRQGSLVLAGTLLVLLPVAARNQVVGGRFVLTTSGAGTNFYGGNNPDNPFGVATEFAWVRGIPRYEADDWKHEAERRTGRALDSSQTSSFWLHEALSSMARQPALHLRILWNKLRLSLGRHEVPDNHFIEWDAAYVAMLRWPLPGFESAGLLGLAGVLVAVASLLRRRARGLVVPSAVVLALLFALYLGTIVATVTSERVRLALVPLLLPFGAWLLLALVRRRAPPWESALGLALAAAVVFTSPMPASRLAADFDERDFNLAAAWLGQGALGSELDELVAGLEQKHPESARIQVLAADLEFRRARVIFERETKTQAELARANELTQGALQRLERAARADTPRERFRARFARGALLQYFGQWEAAAADYRSAREFDPSDGELRHRLAVVLAELAMAGDAAQRPARLEEARALLLELLAKEERAESRQLLSKLEALR